MHRAIRAALLALLLCGCGSTVVPPSASPSPSPAPSSFPPGDPGPARLELALAPAAEDRSLIVLVQEIACHGFASEVGRTVWDIDYGESEITVTIGVIPLPGGADCPLPPPAQIVIPLEEPVGERAIDLVPWPEADPDG